MADLLERLQSGYCLPTLSPVAMKIVEMASDETCSTESMAALIEKDPSLAVRLLRLANSAFFAARYPIGTVREAILRIGVERLRIMALSLSLRDTFPMGRVGSMDYEAFWRCSLYRALLSNALARNLRTCSPEEAFVAGLTREVGLLIFVDMFLKDADDPVDLAQNATEPLLSWERERTGTDHRAIGEAALRYWRFPDGIVTCQLPPERCRQKAGEHPLLQVCETAGTLSSLICEASVEMGSSFVRIEERCGLSQESIQEMLVTTFDQVEEIAESLQIQVNKEKDVVELLEKANRALTRLFRDRPSDLQSSVERGLPCFEGLWEETSNPLTVSRTLEAVSHEFRNPLMVVGGLARRLSRTVEPASAGGQYVRSILEEVSRLEQAMNQMTRMASGE